MIYITEAVNNRSDREMLTGDLYHWEVLITLYADYEHRIRETFAQIGVDPGIVGRCVGVLLENQEPIADQSAFITQAARRVYPQGASPGEVERLGVHTRVASFLIDKLELAKLNDRHRPRS